LASKANSTETTYYLDWFNPFDIVLMILLKNLLWTSQEQKNQQVNRQQPSDVAQTSSAAQ
jgi:hypothetical protein